MLDSILNSVKKQKPFFDLPDSLLELLFSNAKIYSFEVGERILRPDEMPSEVYLLVSGEARFLVVQPESGRPYTLSKVGPGQFFGWSSLLRGSPCEWVTASEKTYVLAISASSFLDVILSSDIFADFYSNLPSIQESYYVAARIHGDNPKRPRGWADELTEQAKTAWVTTVFPEKPFDPPTSCPKDLNWVLSTPDVPNHPVGSSISVEECLPARDGYLLPYRLIGYFEPASKPLSSPSSTIESLAEARKTLKVVPTLSSLGIVEDDLRIDEDRFPIIRGKGIHAETLAVCEMVSLYQDVPFRRDVISKVLEDQLRRNKDFSVEVIGGLTELLGMNTLIAEIDTEYIDSIETPAVLYLENVPVVLYSKVQNQEVTIGHPNHGLIKYSLDDIINKLGPCAKFALPKRISTTPTSRFGFNWFTPLLKKYKRSLTLVFVASLLAQLFGLAVPLLIQQIIDKTLSQGNLSSLNVLGTAMITMALFQGILTVLRTYIFVDTTDRMDLTLGTSVIDRLLSLPLRFFEKRPVGELSQRIGELNNIRSFLTGTALVSVLNIVFATMYLIVMLAYSPLLTAVALSTLPLYVLIIFVCAPIYKSLIRKKAVAQARTQSHLIEVLGGIQTVKAQHFELTARWKWQDRYRHYVSEGFKSTALGASASEVGNFLNTTSGLLVLWIGMFLVLKGELTLGMLIAFRIISGNVTGPLLQLSVLYQGFQAVQLSMERLADIIDQNPELSNPEEFGQIPMPPIEGSIRYDNVSFRFGPSGAYQVDNVSFEIPKSSFVGIVGKSGSGKSTLTKLLPRLYEPNKGKIYIDDYDISKVDLSSLRRQIGIVPQDSLLFEGTIAENIALNHPNADTESIIEAAKIACAHDFIMNLSQGYATQIAERGSNLSGGQRQRIAIARTVLSNPQLLVMDEATSALDFDTERQLCNNLQKWASGRTVLFITHRLSSIKNSDLILVMHEGLLEEQGSHVHLMSMNSRYSTLYNQQGLDLG